MRVQQRLFFFVWVLPVSSVKLRNTRVHHAARGHVHGGHLRRLFAAFDRTERVVGVLGGWVTHVVQSCERKKKKGKKKIFGQFCATFFSCCASSFSFAGCTGVAYRSDVYVSGYLKNLLNLFVVWDGRGRGRCWRTAEVNAILSEKFASLQAHFQVSFAPQGTASGATASAWVHDPFGVRPVRC